MNTMADGARERLVAQIGEALFGQPGLTLMELENRVRYARAGGGPLLCGSCYGLGVIGYTSGQTPEQFEQGEYPCPDCALPSPAGQVGGLIERLRERAAAARQEGNATAIGDAVHFEQAAAGLAARHPVGAAVKDPLTVGVGQAVAWMTHHDEPMLFPTFSEAAAYCDEEEPPIPLYAAPTVQAVDLPYSLDADPAGVRVRVADAITGTLMVGAQGHTPPPAGHWAEPFWQAAQADTRMLQRTWDALRAATKSLRTIANSNKHTEFLETASEIRAYANSRASCAEQALATSKAVGNG